MDRTPAKPSIVNNVPCYELWQASPFSLTIHDIFFPQDGSLVFSSAHQLSWLKLDPHRGILYGVAPKVTHDKNFHITIVAQNEFGAAAYELTLKVKSTDVVETIPGSLEFILSLRQEEYGLSHLHPYTPSLLEYIYIYFNLPQFREHFLQSLQHAANAIHFKLPEKIEFKDFKELLTTINPNAEQLLLEKYLLEHEQDQVLTMEALNNWELRNLFLQGSQPQGVHAIPVWNHWGYPDLHNWTDGGVISNVLDSAADSVRRIKTLNIELMQQQTLKPK